MSSSRRDEIRAAQRARAQAVTAYAAVLARDPAVPAEVLPPMILDCFPHQCPPEAVWRSWETAALSLVNHLTRQLDQLTKETTP